MAQHVTYLLCLENAYSRTLYSLNIRKHIRASSREILLTTRSSRWSWPLETKMRPIVGLVYGTIFRITGRLFMLMCAHAAFDLATLVIFTATSFDASSLG